MPVQAGEKSVSNINGIDKKWRIGYCESEPYVEYATTLYNILLGLQEKGLIDGVNEIPYAEGQEDTSQIWKYISSHDLGKNIEFVPNAYFDLKDMNNESAGEEVVETINKKNNVDLMLVMGTKAGLALAKKENSIKTLIFSTSDPIGAGIVKSANDSGQDNIWAHVDKGQFKRQVEVFNDVFKFKKMGIVYENSSLVENYIGLKDIEEVSKERNFELVRYYVTEPKDDSDYERYYNDVKNAYEKMSGEVDAALLTISSIHPNQISELMQPFYAKRKPVFSQMGADEVKHGALMSITLIDFSELKTFAADTIEKVLKGANPRELTQVFESTPHIILNYEAAKLSGYKPPIDILLVADKIYNNIER